MIFKLFNFQFTTYYYNFQFTTYYYNHFQPRCTRQADSSLSYLQLYCPCGQQKQHYNWLQHVSQGLINYFN